MPRLIYITPTRMPTEKAHGLQIAQNCEAFADAGWTTELWVARRWNPAMRSVDVYEYYGVKRNFTLRSFPTLDLMPLARDRPSLERMALYIILLTFSVSMLCRAAFSRASCFYTRDRVVALGLSLLKRRSTIAYEVHQLTSSKPGAALQQAAVARVGTTFTITERLKADLVARGAEAAFIHLARDAVSESRFVDLPDRLAARREADWPADAFIVGYVGRLHAMGVEKGVGTLLQAVGRLSGASLAIVGGPEAMVDALRDEWRALGLDDRRFLAAGHVAPGYVPVYLRALDICAMPYPTSPYFTYHMSPLKLFEYMASGRPIVASDLPAISEVLQSGKTALLVPAGDIDALTRALDRLRHDATLRERLATNAYDEVMQNYTWAKRAEMILDHLRPA